MMRAMILALGLSIIAQGGLADRIVLPEPRITSGEDGTCYARSERTGSSGRNLRTRFYRIQDDGDERVLHFTWSFGSGDLIIFCNEGSEISFIRTVGGGGAGFDMMGANHLNGLPTTLGQPGPNDRDMAFAYYVGYDIQWAYSTLEISELGVDSENVDLTEEPYFQTVSHYWIFQRPPRSEWEESPTNPLEGRDVLIADTVDGRRLRFDVKDGAFLGVEQIQPFVLFRLRNQK